MRPARTGRGCTSRERQPPPSPPPPGSRSGYPRRGRAIPWPPGWPSARMGTGIRHRHPDPGQRGQSVRHRGLQRRDWGQALAGELRPGHRPQRRERDRGEPRRVHGLRHRQERDSQRRHIVLPVRHHGLRRGHRSPALDGSMLPGRPRGSRVHLRSARQRAGLRHRYQLTRLAPPPTPPSPTARLPALCCGIVATSKAARTVCPLGRRQSGRVRVYVTGEAGGTDGLDDTHGLPSGIWHPTMGGPPRPQRRRQWARRHGDQQEWYRAGPQRGG